MLSVETINVPKNSPCGLFFLNLAANMFSVDEGLLTGEGIEAIARAHREPAQEGLSGHTGLSRSL